MLIEFNPTEPAVMTVIAQGHALTKESAGAPRPKGDRERQGDGKSGLHPWTVVRNHYSFVELRFFPWCNYGYEAGFTQFPEDGTFSQKLDLLPSFNILKTNCSAIHTSLLDDF